ncbi:PP2C family protein-serine/threonine phosphatase [Paenibacillus glacialis]|uniref:Serine/threonine protein phosphatase n=1 Tax=Paenibacillus glacialis TaxID=494026 RepID=A0A168N7Q0_9BACL|nr:protein phosphatase 2C domain-containing protein [Paenibacillus glacialis]OAB45491.1 serine/threonine protein phosphatase [Paenibacillus glacialis]
MQQIKDIEHYIVILSALFLWIILHFVRRALVRHQPTTKIKGIQIGNGQSIGRREEQDDYFSSSTTAVGTFAVIADGISGLSNGRMASTLAVTVFSKEFQLLEKTEDFTSFFAKAATQSNSGILANLSGSNGGTTLVVAVISSGILHWAAVGDSMISVFRDSEFITMNSKHTVETLLREKVLSGEMTKEDAETSPVRKHLVNYLGYEGFRNMEIGEPFTLQKKDKIMLASDGVYDALSEVELEHLLKQKKPAEEIADDIIEQVDAKGLRNQDNATVIILEKGW